ncbi:hypothetical protein D8674_037140 [Pyrus ussuriensis x Pyrus communis]|uniref:Retrovirus-related Pol polyprotein from transposon TNT 1-94 n=1 Tax=Pyrus ussuriensis x Pyrus communis TaxID=2448454 RepID=A0A5N5FPD5_9ROSA|nr:hypothetical protein D8674_037140 [Pyrus ussuriensis x Pyrus communis]
MFVVSLISRFMECPIEMHLAAAKRVLRYLKGTISLGILYRKGGHVELRGYSDSDYAGDLDDRKSTSGYLFMLSSGAMCWSSKKQPVVTSSFMCLSGNLVEKDNEGIRSSSARFYNDFL